ncbi:MAG: DegT/DnrJ/EryC1/StrS family aminotransferase, partial [Actinomycetota bacterium]
MFPEGLPLVRPSVPNAEDLGRDIRAIVESRILTNGPFVRELERRAEEYLGVAHCVAVASCTSGLMLVLRASAVQGEVVVPSFTFMATAHAVVWNGLGVRFADIDPVTLTLAPASVRLALGTEVGAIIATHTYGTPCDVSGLNQVAREGGARLFFDAAHAFGSRVQGQPVGRFGHGEVFSLSPTKVMVAGEGGLITTSDESFAETCRIGRDYGNAGDYDPRFVGLNARMSELHAAFALRSLEGLEERIERRGDLAMLYRGALAGLPGIFFPEVRPGDRSTYKDFTVIVDPDGFGLPARKFADALRPEGIGVRRYYAPPLHRT